MYPLDLQEESLKQRVANDFFSAFDCEKIAFLPYKYIKDFVMRNDFDWTSITPSEHKSEDFRQMQSLTESILRDKSIIFNYAKDIQELHDFIKNSVAIGIFAMVSHRASYDKSKPKRVEIRTG